MAYRTILVHVDAAPGAEARIRLAAQLALAQQAHLVGAASDGMPAYISGYAGGEYCVPVPQRECDALTAAAHAALDQFERIARQVGLDRYERRLSSDLAQGALMLQARYADLLVLSPTDPDAPPPRLLADTSEFLMLHSGKPVLLVPRNGQAGGIGRRPLLAWDGSAAATRAIADALPLLCQAGPAVLAVFNPAQQPTLHGEQPGADMAVFLARHGVTVEVLQRSAPRGAAVGEALLALAADIGADVLVMGGYGHLRAREILLGGVTQTVLASMTLPVLMSH